MEVGGRVVPGRNTRWETHGTPMSDSVPARGGVEIKRVSNVQ